MRFMRIFRNHDSFNGFEDPPRFTMRPPLVLVELLGSHMVNIGGLSLFILAFFGYGEKTGIPLVVLNFEPFIFVGAMILSHTIGGFEWF